MTDAPWENVRRHLWQATALYACAVGLQALLISTSFALGTIAAFEYWPARTLLNQLRRAALHQMANS